MKRRKSKNDQEEEVDDVIIIGDDDMDDVFQVDEDEYDGEKDEPIEEEEEVEYVDDDDADFEEAEKLVPKTSTVYRKSKKKDVLENSLFPLGDFCHGVLLRDHEHRPLWVTEEGHLFLETFNPRYLKVYDFVITIAEPVYRPSLMHEYHLTPYSLYGAVSVGLDTKTILTDLSELCKTALPKQVIQMIKDCTQSYGKAKLILHQNRYFIESANDEGERV